MCTLASGLTNFRGEPGAYTGTSPLQCPLGCLITNLHRFIFFNFLKLFFVWPHPQHMEVPKPGQDKCPDRLISSQLVWKTHTPKNTYT